MLERETRFYITSLGASVTRCQSPNSSPLSSGKTATRGFGPRLAGEKVRPCCCSRERSVPDLGFGDIA